MAPQEDSDTDRPTAPVKLSAWMAIDSQRILERAESALDDPELMLVEPKDPDPVHAARMELWRLVMLGHFQKMTSELEDYIEHDVETWIEANAPSILDAYLDSIGGSEVSESEVQEAIKSLDESGMRHLYERGLAELLLDTWQKVEAMIEARVAKDQRNA
ncbi:hypothetical protein LRD18_12405 [Halorhodospira halochloris]|uniref:hypothetical protein n=1 Tax=Halorhodospira halochloris TaxID=1052 RepID=UPI001EE94A58|nr:hypothetical protein [Halorhodospira halochloris]MCG5531640.1 hypothetical protein [Halorhodospira halochloris]